VGPCWPGPGWRRLAPRPRSPEGLQVSFDIKGGPSRSFRFSSKRVLRRSSFFRCASSCRQGEQRKRVNLGGLLLCNPARKLKLVPLLPHALRLLLHVSMALPRHLKERLLASRVVHGRLIHRNLFGSFRCKNLLWGGTALDSEAPRQISPPARGRRILGPARRLRFLPRAPTEKTLACH
jgi:hypothetical protein